MKKFYSLVLMATALLIGTNAKAVDVTDFAGLQDAITNASTTEQTVINVKADITSTAALSINGGKDILLNLVNADITTELGTVFNIQNGKLDIEGTGTISSSATSGQMIVLRGSTESTASNYSVLYIGEGVSIIGQDFAISVQGAGTSGTAKKCSYGVVVNIAGYVYGKGVGVYINGNINKTTGNVPEITISGTVACSAENYLDGTSNYDPNAIYAAGYGKWYITGTVTGALGIYVKAGEFTLDGATVTATGEYTAITHNGSGSSGCGDAIVYDSNKSYADHLSITITGDTKVSSEEGYAIEECVTSGSNKMTSDDFVIESGEFTGAEDKGTLSLTAELGEDVKINGTITGGTYNSDVTEYLSNVTGVITPVEDENGNTVYVVENKPAETDPWISDITAANANSYVRMNGVGTVTLAADAQAKYLVMQGVDKIVIPAGKKLTVGEIVLGKDAVIDVQLGGSLVVKDAQGIVANNAKNILIAAKEGQMGKFMQSPAVTSNKNPHATVTLETKAHKVDADNYVYQRIGVPAFGGITVAEMKANPASASIALAYWDGATQDWAWVPSTSYVIEPFVGLALTNNATTEGTKYTMPCQLMGNSDANLTLVGEWTSFANSYMADVDLYELLGDILAQASGASASVLVYNAPNDWWKTISYGDLNDWKNGGAQPAYTKLEPMQGFIFNNIDPTFNASALISYEKDVWDPVFDPNHAAPLAAPARMSNDNTTRVQIVITAANGQSDDITLRQSEEFSAAFDNGYDMKENVNINPINIFATTELGEMAQLSTDNLVGTKLSVATKGETAFTMTFKNLNGETLAIRDNMTGSVIDMTEGAEYVFSVAENSVSDRFEIVGIKTVPTGMESIQNAEGTKAIYTILGQFVGTVADWSVLPAGIYVIDGVKVVK